MDKNDNLLSDEIDTENIEILGEGELPAEREPSSEEGHSHHSHHSHRSHGHHSRHHSRKRRAKKKKDGKKKFFKFLKKNRSILVNVFACSMVVVLLIIIAVGRDNTEKTDSPVREESDFLDSSIRIEIPLYSEEVSLVSSSITEYTESGNTVTAHEVWRNYKGDVIRLDTGLSFEFTYRVVGMPEDVSVQSTTLEIAEDRSYNNAQVYSMDGENAIDVYNLKTGTQYYYSLNLVLSNGSEVGATGSFKTADTPRFLNIGGVVNARDIGGWKTTDGRTVKQGLLYRGSELDGLVESGYLLTEDGLTEMLTRLGVQFDMDLRSSSDNPDGINALGEGVEHIHYGAPAYSEVLLEENNEIVRSIFSDLADKSNYPIYMHCTYGRDRTGTMCYLLEALLGVSDEDLRCEYELSTFTDGFADLEEYAAFTTHIEYMEGETTQEKVEGYLLSVGVTPGEIASIREIFLGE